MATAIDQSPANEVCFVVRAADLPTGQEPTGVDRLIAITEPGDTGELILTLMVPTDM